MLRISQESNPFAEEALNFSKRIIKGNKKLDPNILNFPSLTEEYIESLTFGIYQPYQAISYTYEHLDKNGNYEFEFFEYSDFENVLHVKIRSRHSNQLVHDLWIKYDYELTLQNGQSPISNCYCTCKCGKRIFGMCAHITSVIWFLGVARHDKNKMKTRKCDIFMKLCMDSSLK